jgi:flagellar biosynthesis protein FliQ
MLQAEQLAFSALTLIFMVGDPMVMGSLISGLIHGFLMNLTDLYADSQASAT